MLEYDATGEPMTRVRPLIKPKHMTLREAILTSVNSHQGMKGVELVMNVMGLINPVMFESDDYVNELCKLVAEGEIVELEYILPQMQYRMKSLYFPKGTTFGAKLSDWHNNDVAGLSK